jgi:hypothetical protein
MNVLLHCVMIQFTPLSRLLKFKIQLLQHLHVLICNVLPVVLEFIVTVFSNTA